MEVLDYENDVKIDSTALDVEWLGQAELMRKYTKHTAKLEKDRDEAKEALDLKKAQIEMEIRKKPESYGLAKPTEAGIQSTILLQKEYQVMVADYNAAKYELNVAIGAVRAIDQRKTALENLVRLLGQGYFAGPVAPRDLQSEATRDSKRREANAQANKKVRFTRTRKPE